MQASSSKIPRDVLPAWKRTLDVLLCVLALPLLAVAAFWAFLITTFASRGPIFFKQERVGYKGRRFLLYKFRTMHVKADTETHQAHFASLMTSNVPMQKLDSRGDSRLIPGGWLLRASGLDELPQIINVLRGEMSIVGPRPCIPYEYTLYTEWQRNRLNSLPGLTGLWQVSGKNRTTFDEMIRLDIAYGQKLSLVEDLRIIVMTPLALWTQILDTRRARRKKPAPAVATVHELSSKSSSATYLARSQNVMSDGHAGGHAPATTRQLPDSCVSYTTSNEPDGLVRGPKEGV